MKKYFLTFALLFATGPLFAWSSPALTYQVGISSITTTIITVSTFTVAPAVNQVDNPQLAGRVVMEINNIDATANLWCVPTSTQPLSSNTGVGRKIAAGGSWVVSVADALIPNPGVLNPIRTAVQFFCISDGASATKAAITQMY